VEGVNSIS